MVISLDSEIAPFEPFGRSIIASVPEHKNRATTDNEHDDLLTLAHHLHNDFTAAELDNTRDLFRSLNDVSISKESSLSQKEFWKVRKCRKGEEEIYVNENTVVTSFKQPNDSATSFLNKTYTFSEKILDATWCNFIANDSINGIASQDLCNLMFKVPSAEVNSAQYPKFLLSSPVADGGAGSGAYSTSQLKSAEANFYRNLNLSKSLCVLDKYSIHILSEGGDHHRKALQFEINKMVPTNFGLLLERVVNDNERLDVNSPQFPLVFTLSNPLNEIVPVLVSTSTINSKQPPTSLLGPSIGYLTRCNDLTLIDFIADKNFAIFHCAKSDTHHIFYLRPVNGTELDWIRQDLEKPAAEESSVPMEVDAKLNHSDQGGLSGSTVHLLSTPIASSQEAVKKQCRLSYPSAASSPITRSMSNHMYSNLVQSTGGPSRLSSPRGSTTSSNATANISPHSGRQSLPAAAAAAVAAAADLSTKRVLSPSTSKLSSLISSRLDSPVSPSLNRLTYTGSTNRLLEADTEMRLHPIGHHSSTAASSFHSSKSIISRSGATPATPTVLRSNELCVQKFPEPIIAEFTLEFVWCESKSSSSASSAISMAASKVFSTSDFLGQNYLCLLVADSRDLLSFASSTLKLIKFDVASTADSESVSSRTRYIFSTTAKISNIKDAEPLKSLNMLLILDDTNALVLYSGIYKVSIVHLQSGPRLSMGLGESSPLATSPTFKKTNLGGPHLGGSPLLGYPDFLSSHIAASSPIVSNTKPSMSGINDSLNLSISTLLPKGLEEDSGSQLAFSIQQYPAFGKIVTIRDSIDNRITFETVDTKLYRLAFPAIATTFLVDKCLAALRQTFPKEVAINFLTAWYTFRNSTNKDEAIPEAILFKLCLLSLIGYNKDAIKEEFIARCQIATSSVPSCANSKLVVVSSPLAVGHSESLEREITKKMKIEDDHGADEDWYALVRNSKNLYGFDKAKLLEESATLKGSGGSKPATRRSKVRTSSEAPPSAASTKATFAFNSPDMLFPHTANILSTLHLVYEDLKLVQMNWPLCRSLVDVLYLLAVDLQLPLYQDHYYRDFPSVCAEVSLEDRYAGHRSKLSHGKNIEKDSPPSIYNALYSLLKTSPSKSTTTATPSSTAADLIHFPFIGSGSVAKTLNTAGAHIITPNIFNLIVLYSNLNTPELVEPQQTLKCIGNNLHSNGTSVGYINVAKFKQIIKLYSGLSSSRSVTVTESPLSSSVKQSSRKSLAHAVLAAQSAVAGARTRTSTAPTTQRDGREKILFLMSALGITADYIKELPFGLALPLWDIINVCRTEPKNDWCSSIYSLIDRPDLLSLEYQEHICQESGQVMTPDDEQQAAEEEESELAYLDHSVLRLLFPDDQRLHEAYQMLISSKAACVNIQQGHGVNDHDFIEEQEKYLYALCIRTMALPLGRGMVTLRSYTPVVAERFPIPVLCLTGKVPPRNTLVELTHIDVPPNMNVWPLFHNGVSAGLRISSNLNKMVDSSWILFNKPANNTTSEEHYAHAGFLLALGLNGLLDNLSIMDLHEYLSKGNDLTKVAILLGLAASKRGTMDSSAFILLGIHLEGLLPSTSTELDVSPIVRVAAVLGVGLLFQGTGHSYIAEVMLNEIGRPPGPEMDHYIDRESYALSAGLAFGLVTLGRGNEMISMVSSEGISIPDQLNHYMLGVHKKLSTLQKEKNKTPSYHIREGDCINADVTSPGATLALGMMFFNTSNKAIAQWLNVPDTQNLLEMVRPDFILLRVLARNLIMWSDIRPTSEWIESHIPPIIFKNAFQKVANTSTALPHEMLHDEIDYETMTQSYCNIIAGACFALALRYAGSADPEAFDVVRKNTVKLITIIQKGTTAHVEQAGRSTIESCVNVLIVSCAIIMAGTGNVEVMRLCRFLRSRINQYHVLYGSFMAIHMAMGLLFLGGCRITLNSSPESVAALICAFFPKYPIHTYDNRYHLQAFRHLYVLATEPRMLIPRCIDTGTPVYAKIRYAFHQHSSEFIEKLAPCILPDLSLLKSVELVDANYWNISFDSQTNFNKLRRCLLFNGNLYIKRKVKCLSYNKEYIYTNDAESNTLTTTDPTALKSLFTQMDRKSFTLFDFTNEVILKTFSDIFINANRTSEAELEVKNRLCSILYDCAEDETLELFAPLIKLIAACQMLLEQKRKWLAASRDDLSTLMNGVASLATTAPYDHELGQQSFQKYFTMWQIKFASLFTSQSAKRQPKFKYIEAICFQLEQAIKATLDKTEVKRYLCGHLPLSQASEALIDTAVFYDLPAKAFTQPKELKFLDLLKQLRLSCPSISTSTAFFIYRLLTDTA